MSRDGKSTEAQSDLLLWVGAGAIVAIAGAWFALGWLGSSTTQSVAPETETRIAVVPEREPDVVARPAAGSEAPAAGTGLDNPLRAAQMAYEAGMLTDPEDYSAWTLFGTALEADPESTAAREGLERVAADLLARGSTAVEQGRYDDATAIADRILARLPDHAGATELRDSIGAAQARRRERAAARRAAPRIRADESAVSSRGSVTTPRVDEGPGARKSSNESSPETLLAQYDDGFKTAVASNHLLAPDEESAKHFVLEMRNVDADDSRTTAAADWLVTEMLGRSRQAAEATDWAAARTWIAEADSLGADADALAEQNAYLADRLAAAESAKRLPASELKLVHYVPPEYPRSAASRGIEGWVDIDFRVTASGETTDVVITDASHDRLFRPEAIRAVSEWAFQPRLFEGRAIDQNVYTRVRFVLTD